MQIRVITMRYSEGLQGFPEETLRTSTYGREVLDCKYEFFSFGNIPHIALVLTLADTTMSSGDKPQFLKKDAGPDPEETMNDKQKIVYRALKKWRNDATKRRGLPTYALGRNSMMVEIVRKAPKTISELKEIDGCGEKYCKEYGKTIISIIGDLEPQPDPVGEGAEESADKKDEAHDGISSDSPAGSEKKQASDNGNDNANASKEAGSKKSEDTKQMEMRLK